MRRILALALVAGSSTACIGFAGLGDDPDSYGRRPDTGIASDASDGEGGIARDGGAGDGCTSETDSELKAAQCGVGSCGTRTVRDVCNVERTVDCGSTCASPPSTTCADPFTKRDYPSTGTCQSGVCTYAPIDSSCGAPTCAGGRATAAGTCSGGMCTAGATTTCGFGCAGDVCAGDPCEGVTCDTQQAPTCKNATTRTTYAATGTCSGGSCSYAPTDTACAPATCTANVATAASVCTAGACLPGAQTSCSWGCNGSVCAADPCLTTTCNAPPAPTCADATTRRTFAATGACSSATGSAACSYAPTNTPCPAGQACIGGQCATETGATTAGMSGPGLSDCGVNGNDVCARSLLVTGGTYYRGDTTNYPATISDFRLDKYEVTVGRFRKFVDAWVGGWRPSAGAGKHAHLNGGQGLSRAPSGFEAGWVSAWSNYVGAPSDTPAEPSGAGATSLTAWNASLSCNSAWQTWTPSAGPNESKPANCLTWYDLQAFCIWDGGFLPTETEWEYAAVGGGEERLYPWGNTPPAADTALAIYGCYFNASGTCTGSVNIARVGTVGSGASKSGQLDLAGNAWEWTADWYQPYTVPCVDCASTASGSRRSLRGGSFQYDAATLLPASRVSESPAYRINYVIGGRCARPPAGGNCTAETDAAFCTRLGATCGSKSGTDNCGNARTVANCGACANGLSCSALNVCAQPELTARTASMSGDGINNCGANGDDNCARSPLVTGGTFNRGTDTSNPATVSDFRLDTYEVTVGRFRKFVDAWVGGWRPPVASGKHTHLNGGSGLANTAGGDEPGWDATWTNYVGAPSNVGVTPTGAGATTKAAWDTNLSCHSTYPTWTSAAGPNEKRPQNCLSWYDLHSFCIWDGGFLPSEAEWEYATAGGSEERTYAWGNTATGANTALAIYGCYYNGSGSCTGVTNIAPVGTVAAGVGKWGQLDLAGNLSEWNLDWHQGSYVSSCNNCTNLTSSSYRVIRGGSFDTDALGLPAALRNVRHPANRNHILGGRCARSP
jgi:sulfatase modifying factor 1